MSFEPFDLFRQKQWHLRMGLKPLDLADWIHVDDHFQQQLLLKETLLAQDPSACFAALPDSMKGQREVFDTVLTHLLKYFPHIYRLDTASKSIHHAQSIHNLVTGQSWTIQDLTPLDLAGRLVQEDLLLLQPLNHEFQLMAGSLCFPSYWRLQDKLGLPLSQIHDPVPDYAKHLTSKVTHYFDHMRSNRPGWRWNWSLTDTPDLRLAEERSRGSVITRHNAGLSLWLRIERQTLRRLSEQVLFSIHTYIHPLEDIVSDPEQAVGLSRILHTMPESTQRYKGLWDIREELLAYLDLKQ